VIHTPDGPCPPENPAVSLYTSLMARTVFNPFGVAMQNHHPLIVEFPEHKDNIHQLKLNNPHFRRLAFEYEGIDKAIVRAEQGIEVLGDDYLETLKKERLMLKDMLFDMLQTA
jgi:uncharacterized protein YdcH (DUF465 family)